MVKRKNKKKEKKINLANWIRCYPVEEDWIATY